MKQITIPTGDLQSLRNWANSYAWQKISAMGSAVFLEFSDNWPKDPDLGLSARIFGNLPFVGIDEKAVTNVVSGLVRDTPPQPDYTPEDCAKYLEIIKSVASRRLNRFLRHLKAEDDIKGRTLADVISEGISKVEGQALYNAIQKQVTGRTKLPELTEMRELIGAELKDYFWRRAALALSNPQMQPFVNSAAVVDYAAERLQIKLR